MRRSICCGIAASLLFFSALPTHAQDELVGDRPDVTESAVTIAPGHVQLEAGTTWERTDVFDAITVGEMLARVGLLQGVEIRLGVPSYVSVSDDGPSGFEDASLGLKFLLNMHNRKQAALPQAALIVESTLPTGSAEIGTSWLQPAALLAFEWPLAEGTGLGINVGAARVRTEDVDRVQGLASAVLGRDFTDRLGGFIELYGFTGESPDEDPRLFVDGGATLSLTPDLQLDARLGTELGNGFADQQIGVGVVWRY